jgi:hypothetical protein
MLDPFFGRSRPLLVSAALLASACSRYVLETPPADSGGSTVLPGSDAGDAGDGRDASGASDASDAGQSASDADSGIAPCTGFRTCAEQGIECGPAGDGCGNLIQCGTCQAPQTCGGGGTASVCGGQQGCVPRTCQSAGAACGKVSDGCGGLLECGTCAKPLACGGAGVPFQCGGSVEADGGSACVPLTCAGLGYHCGLAGDGCGGALDCGTCTAPETCGGGGKVGECGKKCVPKTCADFGRECGEVGDGCGGLLQCGTCAAPETCGGGGTPGKCGSATCKPKTCEELGMNCVIAGDGCGGVAPCGTCAPPQSCGGGGQFGQCGGTQACVRKTCEDLGYTCGPAGDGCGGLLACGSCKLPETCGGGGVPGVCGSPATCQPKTCAQLGATCGPVGDGCGGLLDCGSCKLRGETCGGLEPSKCGIAPTCTGLCKQQDPCGAGGTTTVSGIVYDPAGKTPLYNMLVYIPNSAVQPFSPGVSCDQCTASVSGSPLVSAYTDTSGRFSLSNAPVGDKIPLVIQSGRWRRQVTISVKACQDNPIAADLTRLPRNKGEGDIPFMAISTGAVDALECVLRKMGVDDSEFTPSSGTGATGRIHLYKGAGSEGANKGSDTQSETVLLDSLSNLKKYDMVLFPCQGKEYTGRVSAKRKQNLVDYANAGGRLFATHFSYVWLNNNYPFSGTAHWNPSQTRPPDQDGILDRSFPKGEALTQWLRNVRAASTLGQIPVQVLRNDVKGVVAPSQSWMTVPDPDHGSVGVTLHYTFNTPVGVSEDNQCGRVLFDDFHVEDKQYDQTTGKVFPAECSTGDMTPQEKLLEFMLFDLGSCITPDAPTCTPKTCDQLGFNCGPQADGCGGQLDCGTCPGSLTCGGGGVPGVCGEQICKPKTCADLGFDCGPAGNGCGGQLDCGTCSGGLVCGGGGPGKCGPAPTCTPKTCQELGFNCGIQGDGCGGGLDCGTCTAPEFCGGGGPSVCGFPTCTPLTCAAQGLNCGSTGDGCGKRLDCGTCQAPQVCGGAGTPGVCGLVCSPKSCAELGFNCGPAGDGCGGGLDCGTCAAGSFCGGGGKPGVCSPANLCKPLTCANQGLHCGPAGDGCGNAIDCGACTAPGETCGGGGTPGVCGKPNCTPVTCEKLGYDCGIAGDGCGGSMDCGTCEPSQVCGGGGMPNRCSTGPN